VVSFHPEDTVSAHPTPPAGAPCAGDSALDLILAELRALRELVQGNRKPLLTIDEVARLTGRDPYTVRRWVKEGRLRATRVQGTGPRGRLLVAREELDRLLAAGRAARAPAVAFAGPVG
jgi:excisionase family DNA binding protein